MMIVRSLSGKTLSQNWPSIISDEEEHTVYTNTLKSPHDLQIEKLSYELTYKNKRLLYLAAVHIRGIINKKHPQFEEIKKRFESFKPDLVLYEGGESNPSEINIIDAYKLGEKAFLQYLVLNHNKLNPKKQVMMKSGDITDKQMVIEYQKHGYSNEDIIIGDILKAIYAVISYIVISPYNEDKKLELLKEEKNTFFTNPLVWFTTKGFPNIKEYLPEVNGKALSNDLIISFISSFKETLFTLDFDPRTINKYKKMYEDSRIFRDQYIVKNIADSLSKYNRVLVLFGSSHAIRERNALIELFS